MKIKPGDKYRHFKGGEFEVVCCAKHTETNEELVIYRALDGTNEIFARPIELWDDPVSMGCSGAFSRFEPIY